MIDEVISILTLNRAKIVRWVCENARPFNIVSDHSFHSLMKNSYPRYYILSPSTVSRDVHQVFVHTRNRISKRLNLSNLQANIDKAYLAHETDEKLCQGILSFQCVINVVQHLVICVIKRLGDQFLLFEILC